MRRAWMLGLGGALWLAGTPSIADGYFKCETPQGIEYADAPCAGDAQRRDFPNQYEREQRRAEHQRAAACFRPSRTFEPGNKASDLAELCGTPRRVRRVTTVRGTEERWEYRQGQGAAFVWVEDGIITAIQD